MTRPPFAGPLALTGPLAVTMLAMVVLVACGGGSDDRGSAVRDHVIRTAQPPAPATTTSERDEGERAPFADACIAGDPEQREASAVRGLDSTFQALAIELIEQMSSRDSAALAVRLARTTDGLPSDTMIADFRGLPVVVRAAWRVLASADDTVVVAVTTRRLPIESRPLEETFVVVAEPRRQPSLRDPLVARWHLREVGLEEAVDPPNLAAAWLRPRGVSLLFLRGAADPIEAELLRRIDTTWAREWRGELLRCLAP